MIDLKPKRQMFSLARWACMIFFVLLHSLQTFAQAGSSLSTLSLEKYLGEVRGKNDGFKSANESTEAATLEGQEADLLIEPNLYAQAYHQDDQKPSTLFSAADTITDVWSVGLSETTSFGLSGKLHYDLTNLTYNGFSFPGYPLFNEAFSQGSPVLELTLSLWRNFGGAEVKSQREVGAATAEAKRHQETFAMQNLIAQAESAYWMLNFSRESIKIAQEAVDRARTLVDWNYKKSRTGLADHAEYLQAQAALESHIVDLKNAENDLVTTSRNFNSFRQVESDHVEEDLEIMDPSQFHNLRLPTKVDDREDVKAALAQSRVARASAELSRQKYKPTLELFGLSATNNPNPTALTTSIPDSFSWSRPTSQIGIRLNTPLDWGLVSDVKKGYLRDQMAADLDVKRKRFDQNVAWNDLQDRYRQNLSMLSLYEKLEKVQYDKLTHERDRRAKGRTTTQQVLYFEIDYEQAQLSKIRVMSDMLQLVAQMKLYGSAQ
jgi:outer membrane protein TolC